MRSFIQFPSCILHVFLVVSTQGLPLLKSLAKKRTGPRKAPFFSGETSVEWAGEHGGERLSNGFLSKQVSKPGITRGWFKGNL